MYIRTHARVNVYVARAARLADSDVHGGAVARALVMPLKEKGWAAREEEHGSSQCAWWWRWWRTNCGHMRASKQDTVARSVRRSQECAEYVVQLGSQGKACESGQQEDHTYVHAFPSLVLSISASSKMHYRSF